MVRTCTGCGEGSYANLDNRSYSAHRRFCSGILFDAVCDLTRPDAVLTNNNNSNNNGYSNPPIFRVPVDAAGNPITNRGLLQAHINNNGEDQPRFEFPVNVDNMLEAEDDDLPNNQNELTSNRKNAMPICNKDVELDNSYSFQIELMDILQRHGSDLGMHDELINLLQKYLQFGKLDPEHVDLLTRKKFISTIEKDFKTKSLKPKHVNVTLSDGTEATVSLFDIEHMILSLLSDESLMKDENLAPGYDIFTGDVDENNSHNQNYGEIHTGDAWTEARNHYCGTDGKNMPIALIIFGDKTHTDLHGSLSVTPIIFTLSLFNKSARNNPSFWRPLAYIPNLSHGRGKTNKTKPITKCQDEHACLALAFKDLCDLHKKSVE